MILPTLIVPKMINKKLEYLSPDTPEDSTNKHQFNSWPSKISYEFNSRGFRDSEWPEDLDKAVWFLGDSVVLGIGQSLPTILCSQFNSITGRTTVNLGVRGVSNHTTAYVAQQVLNEVQPANLVICWSYFYRRPIKDTYDFLVEGHTHSIKSDDVEDMFYFRNLVGHLPTNFKTNIIHVFCPGYSVLSQDLAQRAWSDIRDPLWPPKFTELDHLPSGIVEEISCVHGLYNFFKNVPEWNRFKKSLEHVVDNIMIQDRARDAYHWGSETNKSVVLEIQKKLR